MVDARLATILFLFQAAGPPAFDVMTEMTVDDAIFDRLVHASHHIELKGETLKKTVI